MTWDAIIIGAGPAGMAAAILLADHDARVLVLDEQPAPGGQIYRGVEDMAMRMPDLFAALGDDYAHGDELAARFRNCGADYRPGAMVWQVNPGAPAEVWYSQSGRSEMETATSVLVATGAMERPVPVPGWTLPGAMTAGAVQVLLKSAGVVGEEMVIAGAGPLVYLLAAQCLAVGARPMALLDTTPAGNLRAALPKLPGALLGKGLSYLRKGLALKAAIRRADVPIYTGVTDISLKGTSDVTDIEFKSDGRPLWLSTPIVALHEGVIPAQQMTRAIGCDHAWDPIQHCFRPVIVDGFGNSTIPGILVAGDGAGIGGARAAEHAGRLAAADMLRRAGHIDPDERDRLAAPDERGHAAHLAIRPFLDRLYAPPAWALSPPDDVIVCRCEEVTAGKIRAAADQGAQGPNQAKSFLRAGMGPCQGRICGPMVSEILATRLGKPVAETGYYRVRPPLKPVPVAEIAAIEPE